jgi:hypothetical protein
VPAPPANPGSVSVSQSAVLLTGRGQTAQLTGEATAPDGSPLSVTWSSSDPSVVSVDGQGNVTALADLGSALIYAETEYRSTPVAILIAEPAAGAVLVGDAHIASPPQPLGDPNAFPQNGDRYRVTLTGMSAPSPGAILLATGSALLGGRVITAIADRGEVVVEYELVALPEMFARYAVDLDLPLDLLDAGLEPTAGSGYIASVAGPELPLPQTADAQGKVEKEAEFNPGPLECKLSAAAKFKSSNFDIKATTNLKLEVEGRKVIENASTPEHTKVVLTGPVALDVTGGLKAEAGFEGKAECELKKHIPIPIGGVLALVLAITVPIGLTAGFEGSVKAVDVELGPHGHLGTTVTVGFQCDTSACWAIKEHTPDQNNGITFESKVNVLRDMKVEASFAINVVTGLGFKVADDEYSLIDAKIGPVQSWNVAFDDTQAGDQGYASAYDLKVAGSVAPGDDLKSAISRVFGGEVSLDLSAKYESEPLSESPKGRLSVEKPRVELGKTVALYVDIDPAKTLDYFLLGPNVVELRIFRWKDGRLTPVGTMPVSASGQTRFEYIWTPTRDFVGMNELVAFVTTRGLPAVPLEIAPNSTAYVEVVEACLGETPTPGPVQPSPVGSASPGPVSPTAPPEDPCVADGTLIYTTTAQTRVPADQQLPTVSDTIVVTTMNAVLEQDPIDPLSFRAASGSWSIEYAYDHWQDRTFNDGADGCILTEHASASLRGSWDEVSYVQLSYDPVSLWATVSFVVQPSGQVPTTAQCPGVFDSTTNPVDADVLLTRTAIRSVQGRREGDRIVFDFAESDTANMSDYHSFSSSLTGRLSISE